MSKKQGPPLATLMRRLAETPSDFLRQPFYQKEASYQTPVNVTAVISDLLFDTCGAFINRDRVDLLESEITPKNTSYMGIVLFVCHLLHDKWFLHNKLDPDKIMDFILEKKLKKLAQIVQFRKFIQDPERREELVRLVLDAVDLVPEGETESVAADRLLTLDSIEREKIIDKTRASQKRARELREAMARKEAEEAASKAMRE